MVEAIGAAIAGGLINSAGQIYANKQNIDANLSRFRDQIDLANTAHQREILDLQNAGLNPILSASGSGSAVPQLGAPEVGNVTDELGRQVSSAGRLAALDIPLKESQVALNSAQAENLRNDGVLKRVQAEMIARGEENAKSSAQAVKDAGESFGDRFGNWLAEMFGPQPAEPTLTKRAIERRMLKDDKEWNEAVDKYRSLGLPNRVRTKRRK